MLGRGESLVFQSSLLAPNENQQRRSFLLCEVLASKVRFPPRIATAVLFAQDVKTDVFEFESLLMPSLDLRSRKQSCVLPARVFSLPFYNYLINPNKIEKEL